MIANNPAAAEPPADAAPEHARHAAQGTRCARGASEQPTERVLIFDTTLRDGEQSPGASMTLEDKKQVAALLDEMGVDIIEAGFAIASNGDFEAVREISKQTRNARVCSLARAAAKDIDRAFDALRDARQPRIHTFISTSPVHRKHKLQMEADEVLEAVRFSVSRARNLVEDVEWSPEDATRTEHDFLCRCVEAAITAGAATINIPDTVGYSEPEEFFRLIAMLRERVPNSDQAIFSVHCHNDLGLAVANSLAGVRAGARQVECTVNGLGERAGNAAMEELVMTLKTRGDRFPYATGINAEKIAKASKLVSSVTSFPVQYNKAIVGRNAFAHESGIHQDGMLKHHQTYEIMTPESVGFTSSSLVMGKHSGRHAFRVKLQEMGYDMDDERLENVFRRFKELADKKKEILDDDIVALVGDNFALGNERLQVANLHVVSHAGDAGRGGANVDLTLYVDGEAHSASVAEDGPVSAIFRAIREIFPHTARLCLYEVRAVTGGRDAQADVSVHLEEEGGGVIIGRATDTDTLLATTRAYISALNRMSGRAQSSIPRALRAL